MRYLCERSSIVVDFSTASSQKCFLYVSLEKICSYDEEEILLLFALVQSASTRRRFWVHPVNQKREQITALYGHLDAATTTKINYLPNGFVGGYELIINNTGPSLKHPDRPPAIKQSNKIVRTDTTFTRIDERVEGENVFVNVQSLITKPKEKPRYPVSAVLSVPSTRFNDDGVEEKVKLTFAKIGPYAALIVPVQKLGESTGLGNDYSLPPEIRNSIKAFIEVSDLPVSKEKKGYSYPPKSTGDGESGQGAEANPSRRINKIGPYEPAKYENHSCDGDTDQHHVHHHLPCDGIQESSTTESPASTSSKGLIITFPNKNLTLFAPTSERKVENDKSEETSNKLYPYGPAVNLSMSNEAEVVTQKTAQTVKSPYYYSFSLSKQPSNVSRTVNEKKEPHTGRTLASSEHGSGAPFLYSLGGLGVYGNVAARKRLPVQRAYGLPPYRNLLAVYPRTF